LIELSGLDGMCGTYQESVVGAVNYIKSRKPGDVNLYDDKVQNIKKITDFIRDSVDKLIAIELSHYNTLKAREE
jgi:hypothetical protein